MNTLTVTQGQNGYPQNMYKVITADTFTELKEIQSRHGGDLITLKQRAGWSMWENLGYRNSNFLNMPACDSDTVIRYRSGDNIDRIAYEFVIGDYPSVLAALVDIIPDASIGELQDKLKDWGESIEEIQNTIIEGVDIDIWLRRPNPSDGIDFEVNEDDISYTTDVWTYRIALKVDNIDSIFKLSEIIQTLSKSPNTSNI